MVVEKVASLNFNIVGEVNHPGYFPLTRRMTVLDAISLAGGFKDFAKTKKIYVLRQGANGSQQRLPFNYKDVITGKNAAGKHPDASPGTQRSVFRKRTEGR